MQSLKIRKAVLSDAAPGALLHVQTWQSAYRGLMPDHYLRSLNVEHFEQNWRKGIENSDGSSLRVVAEENNRLIGFAGGGPARWPSEGFNDELYAIYVHPDQQGRGVGKQLLRHYMEWLREGGRLSFMLWVLKENVSSRRFYEACGGLYLGLEKADRSFGGVALTEVAYGWRRF